MSTAPNPQQMRALRVLANGRRTKSRLAVETYGDDNTSTRSMMSRLSKTLIDMRWVEESKEGRERWMHITNLGREQLPELSVSGESGAVPAPPSLSTVIDSVTRPDPQADHPEDRPRFHLRHAALLALAKLSRRRNGNVNDDYYEAMLRTLAHEPSADERRAHVPAGPSSTASNETLPKDWFVAQDRKVFQSFAAIWDSSDWRKRLIGALVNFQDVETRREAGSELVDLADVITEPGPEAILWTTGAIDLAHYYSFAPASQIDRLTARRLLRKAKELLEATCRDPQLRIASLYRLGRVSSAAAVGWSWNPPAEQASGWTDTSEVSPALGDLRDGEAHQLRSALSSFDLKVVLAGRFNTMLEPFESLLTRHLGRWIMLAIPSSEWVFRRAGGSGIAEEIADWALDMRGRGTLHELLTTRVREDQAFQGSLNRFIDSTQGEGFEVFGKAAGAHLDQAKALLGEPIATCEVPYDRMLLNHFWTPEMVAAHLIAPTAASPITV
jgi:hypothetical protein